ncbi:hypothetical protein Nepgr_021784 [Nepenthes gracilis]|uniref:Uncharacterized protein n=1 Tax=Nepenthes gracilis TaxID=150966 RepID=A0AAD3SZ33_NEPGR|nr:hypothetical protein Nepgr_021784 [Nepenthes gracilis]
MTGLSRLQAEWSREPEDVQRICSETRAWLRAFKYGTPPPYLCHSTFPLISPLSPHSLSRYLSSAIRLFHLLWTVSRAHNSLEALDFLRFKSSTRL